MKKAISFRPLFYIFIFLLCGIVSARKIFGGDTLVIVMLSLGILLTIVWLCVYKKYKFLCVLLLSLVLGGGLFFVGQARYKINDYSQTVAVVGRITDSAKEGEHYYSVILDDVKIEGKSEKNISLFISVYDEQTFKAGDKLAFETKLESVSLWTLKNFNSYYYRNNIGYKAKVGSSEIISLEGGLKIDEKVRMSVKSSLEKNLSSENAGLCYALLFGDKTDVEADTLGSYKNAGIIHILAVSGLHVSFLLSLILGLMKLCRVNKYVSFSLTTIIIIFFAYLCSFTPSVVRAGLMAIFFMISKLVGRRYDTLSSLGLAGTIMLLISPLTAFDIGFLMSVFCVIGISLLSKLLLKGLVKIMPKTVASTLSVSIACQLVTIPFTAYFGGQLNFLSPFVNLIIVPFFGILFPYLVVGVLISCLLPFMGFILAPAGFGFSAVTKLVKFFGNTSLTCAIEKLHIVLIMLFFILLFVFSKLVLLSTKQKAFIVGCLAALISLCGLFCTFQTSQTQKSIVMLYSNSESCYIITSSRGENMAIGYNDVLDDYSREYNVKKLNYFLSLDAVDEDDVKNLSSLGINLFVACSGDSQIENGRYGEQGEFGDFKYEFLVYDDVVLGVNISFDDVNIFVASDGKDNYSDCYNEYFSSHIPNVVFVGDNSNINSRVVISRNKSENSWASYEENGNTKFYIRGLSMYKEALD